MEYSNSNSLTNDESKPCSNWQQFFGTKATNFMCSKCFNETNSVNTLTKENSINLLKNKDFAKAGNESLIGNNPHQTTLDVLMELEPEAKVEEKKMPEAEPEKPKVSYTKPIPCEFATESSPVSHHILLQKKNRCHYWNKKTGLLGFDCKCGFNFWSKHRHGDDHKCGFDYQDENKLKLERENPLVEPSKFGRI